MSAGTGTRRHAIPPRRPGTPTGCSRSTQVPLLPAGRVRHRRQRGSTRCGRLPSRDPQRAESTGRTSGGRRRRADDRAALDRYAPAARGAPGSLGAGDPGACAEALTAVQQAETPPDALSASDPHGPRVIRQQCPTPPGTRGRDQAR
ncbi:hypothetical protein HBB16_17755 [Pseudonocardia sp. MCCB 268]|nr:hypothetical protein [Pseudonocardia cytotoxica]